MVPIVGTESRPDRCVVRSWRLPTTGLRGNYLCKVSAHPTDRQEFELGEVPRLKDEKLEIFSSLEFGLSIENR